jgi:hypothetical protein
MPVVAIFALGSAIKIGDRIPLPNIFKGDRSASVKTAIALSLLIFFFFPKPANRSVCFLSQPA